MHCTTNDSNIIKAYLLFSRKYTVFSRLEITLYDIPKSGKALIYISLKTFS